MWLPTIWTLCLCLGAVVATWTFDTPFYPSVEGVEARGQALLHIRRPQGPGSALNPLWIPPSSIASACNLYRVNVNTQFTATGVLGVLDHSEYLNDTQLNPAEMYCLMPEDIQGGSDPTACDSLDGVPCTIQEMLGLGTLAIRSYTNGARVAPTFAFFAFNHVQDNVMSDPACDTRGGSGLSNCVDLPFLSRLVSPDCQSCAYDVVSADMCFHTTGIPPLPIFDSGSPNNVPCADPTQCHWYVCFSIQRQDSSTVVVSSTAIFQPYVASGSPGCVGGNLMSRTCFAQAVYDSRLPRSRVQVSDYQCHEQCAFPCATSEQVNLGECTGSSGSNRTCPPSSQDKLCTVDLLLDTLCADDGAQPVVYKDPVVAAANGEDPYEPAETALFPGQLRQCSQVGDRNCADPICLCLAKEGCPGHVKCNGHGSYHESLVPWVPKVCHCEDGYVGEMCQFRVPDVRCSRGQLSSAVPEFYGLRQVT